MISFSSLPPHSEIDEKREKGRAEDCLHLSLTIVANGRNGLVRLVVLCLAKGVRKGDLIRRVTDGSGFSSVQLRWPVWLFSLAYCASSLVPEQFVL